LDRRSSITIKVKRAGHLELECPLACFNRYAADFAVLLSFFLADSSSLIAWDNFEAAKTIDEPVPSPGGHA
jgi:hypothetical protein